MKTIVTTIICLTLLASGTLLMSCNENKSKPKENEATEIHDHNAMMNHFKMENDHRISLNLSPEMAEHQLMNMRNHLVAVQSILNYLSKNEFEKASEVASSQLGLTEEMKMMCSSFGNKEFENLGLAFHNNADKMSEIFKSRDQNKSLEALSVTINSCINCHSTFKQ